MSLQVRRASPGDYDRIVAVLDHWWGRPIAASLPRLFLDHFYPTSSVAEDEQGLAGFLVGFLSPGQPTVGYVHFVGVRPDQRRSGLARLLYGQFADHARRNGCREIKAITSEVNSASIRHRRLGFTASDPRPGYDGPGAAMVTFRLELLPPTD
jgi:GNAT superfamily N-acetyltransferase